MVVLYPLVIPAKRTFQKLHLTRSFLDEFIFFDEFVCRRVLCGLALGRCVMLSFSFSSCFYPPRFPCGMIGCQYPVRSRRLWVIWRHRASAWAPALPHTRHRRQCNRSMSRAKAPSTVIARARIHRRPSEEVTRSATSARMAP